MDEIKISEEMQEKHGLRPFDVADYLENEEMQSAYLSAILEDGTPDEIIQALRDIARAKGIAKVAEETGLGRESLYKTLSEGSKPRFETILKNRPQLRLRAHY